MPELSLPESPAQPELLGEKVRFYVDGLQLDGELWVPPGNCPAPVVVVCSGYQGLKDIHPARFARAFAPQGLAVLGFDYRGFGWSEGARGRLVPQEQVEDVRAAVSLLESDDRIDSSRIALLGWALGGGVAIAEAATDRRVGAVATVNAVADGLRTTRRAHTDGSWEVLLGRLRADRAARVRSGRSGLIGAFEALPLGSGSTASYVGGELVPVPGFGTDVSLESIDALLRFRAEDLVDQIAPRPLLLLHGTANDLYPFEESERLAERASDQTLLVPLQDAGHTEWMHDDNPRFQAVAQYLLTFFRDHELPSAPLEA